MLANTIQQHSEDGRFSIANKEWANGYYMPEDDILWHYSVESHPGLVNLFVDRVQKEWQALGLFDRSHCTEDGDYKRKSHPHQNCEWHWKCYEKTDRRSDLLWLIVVFVFT